MIGKALFSSERIDWETPAEIYDPLNDEFFFTLDPCCTRANQKCLHGFTEEEDGLSQEWHGNVYMNPPYGRQIIDWVKKAYEESQTNQVGVVIGLLPVRTDTRWFHDWVYGKAEIRFLKGRIKFVGAPASAPFPSMVVIWN